jgi:hypothetical protein
MLQISDPRNVARVEGETKSRQTLRAVILFIPQINVTRTVHQFSLVNMQEFENQIFNSFTLLLQKIKVTINV